MRLLILLFTLSSGVTASDLGIRFSKVSIDPSFNTSAIDLPLTNRHYPIRQRTYNWLRNCIASTVLMQKHCKECYWDVQTLIQMAGGSPYQPSTKERNPFWDELAYVVEIQNLRRQNVDPKTIMPLPDAWENFTISDVAEAVHDEFLGIYHINLLTKWSKAKQIKIDTTVIPTVSKIDFLRSMVLLGDLVTWAIARTGPSNFVLKWHVGLARPEEIAIKIARGEITRGPPKSLVADIRAMNLESQHEFTAYPEGCPRHPSWPAMHAASSAASLWMPVVMDLTPAQICQIKLTDYAIAFGRTVAGVHYNSDNMAGLRLAQELIAELLPDWLYEKYGSSIDIVNEKIESVRFNWDDFLESECATGLMK